MLPHISILPEGRIKKAFFVGYMVNRLIQASLGRSGEDDRDYYGKKRLDMAGQLLSSLFRQLFREYVDTVKKKMERELENGRTDFNVASIMNLDLITKQLKYAIATGNWGKDKHGDVQKTGVA